MYPDFNQQTMKTKKALLFFILLLSPFYIQAQTVDSKNTYNILLTGASFASPNNGWFELGCEKLDAKGVNRAIGGEAIANTANRMIEGTLYSAEELEEMDALVIMQVHEKDVFNESELLPAYTDYTIPFDRSNYAAAYDYVIKRYLTECYELRDNPQSKYYGSKSGKPAIIVLCTHWHDARKIYNTSIRQLAEKWGFPLVEFDKYIGFSKNVPHPVTGKQQSLLFTSDEQVTDGVTYGFHPKNGKNEYIQQRMAAVFVDVMKKVLPLK